MTRLLDLVEPQLDLRETPFSLPGSRLFLLAQEPGLGLHTAEYERSPEESLLLGALVVRDGEGRVLPVHRACVDRIVFGGPEDAKQDAEEGAGEQVTLTFAGTEAVSIAGAPGRRWELEFRASCEVDGQGAWHPGLPSAPSVRVVVQGGMGLDVDPGGRMLRCSGPGAVLVTTGQPPAGGHALHLQGTRATWDRWFDRAPEVRDDLRAVLALCWWVLGINTLRLHGHGRPRVVVPSLLGYVALWQWDAYFIACGLRHGAPDLAHEQLEVALAGQLPDGQLPDVVHDTGVLASSDDLPPTDLAALRRAGSAAADSQRRVALTKPPLTAWAVRKVREVAPDLGDQDAIMHRVLASQRWWFAQADTDHDGLPEYGHPYSSGLDDSPVFDGGLPVLSPDLLAYLHVQDVLLADWARTAGNHVLALECTDRAQRTMAGLMSLWDAASDRLRPHVRGSALASETVVGLLPMLTGSLPEPVARAIVAALDDPVRFGSAHPVPTVSVSDPAHAPDRMWRGPTWVNTNMLIIEGLEASGFPDRARQLAEDTVRGVIRAGGPHEYFDAGTGARPSGATTCFAWSAALVVDLAVRLSR